MRPRSSAHLCARTSAVRSEFAAAFGIESHGPGSGVVPGFRTPTFVSASVPGDGQSSYLPQKPWFL